MRGFFVKTFHELMDGVSCWVKKWPMWLLMGTIKIMDASVCKSMDFSPIGCESFPLCLGHGLLAPHGSSQLETLTLTK
jgi:hypothetical protein